MFEGAQEAGDVDDAGGAWQFSHVVDLLIDLDAARGVVDVDVDDLVGLQLSQFVERAVGRVPVPRVQQDADVVADLAAQCEHVVHVIDKRIRLALAQRLRSDELQAEGDIVIGEDRGDGFKALDVEGAVLVRWPHVRTGHDPGEGAGHADGCGGVSEARQSREVALPLDVRLAPLDWQAECGGTNARLGEGLFQLRRALLFDQVGDLIGGEFQPLKPADLRGRQGLGKGLGSHADGVGTKRFIHDPALLF